MSGHRRTEYLGCRGPVTSSIGSVTRLRRAASAALCFGMAIKRALWLVGLLLAGWGVFHMTLDDYRYKALGSDNPTGAYRAIVAVERATGTACVWARRGWICVDRATFERAKQEGWSAPPPFHGEPLPRANVGTRW
jgi:hypothetical protein